MIPLNTAGKGILGMGFAEPRTSTDAIWIPVFPEAVWGYDLRFMTPYSHDPTTTAICRLEALKTALNAPDGHSRQCLISTLTRYGGEARRAGGERAIPFNLKAIRFGFTLASHISQKPVFVTFREIG